MQYIIIEIEPPYQLSQGTLKTLNESHNYTQKYNYCNKVEVHTWLSKIKLVFILQQMHIQSKRI
jgi:hypothetical protein